MTVLRLAEYESRDGISLTAAQARTLGATGAVTVTPSWQAGEWTVKAAQYVGIVAVDGATVVIRPKVPVARLIFLLGYAVDPRAWREDPVGLADDEELWPAVVHVFARQADRALERGLLQGYRVEEAPLAVLRGRLREADQLRMHSGLPIPLEVRYDEYDIDIPENQLLRAAGERLLRVPQVPPPAIRRLRHLVGRLCEVRRLVPGQPLPATPRSRLNDRYQPALALARLILRSRGIDVFDAGLRATGFLFDMNKVFEDFITVGLAEALAPLGGRCAAQDPHWLDVAGRVVMRPDLVRYGPAGRPVTVVDAKYKTGLPESDLYQILAYCTGLGLVRGHLVYAKGNDVPRRHVVRNAGIEIVQHAVDLDLASTTLLAQVASLATAIHEDAVAVGA
ncbi:MAG: 5-methylcytosine-specific restriction enzyme subunit McrC [Frankiaceae bacterium]|nr:5-methylcytosine-specific restriction enzyme subunit McrC [Frankiaceae bacterium]